MAAISASLRLLSASLLILSPAAASSSVHDLLKNFDLPKGLLPHSTKDYTIADDGTFEVRLKKPCYVQFQDLVYYRKVITGKIAFGAISSIQGIQVKKVFIWFPISKIVADEDSKTIQFQVGFLPESFPVKMFKDVPDCKDENDLSSADGLIREELLPVAETAILMNRTGLKANAKNWHIDAIIEKGKQYS